MRSMRRKCNVIGLAVAFATLVSATSAAATPAFQPAGTAFTATSTGENVFTIASNIKWRCNHVQFTGTTTSPASDTVPVTATYGVATGAAGAWCRLYVGGVFSNATVTPSGWSMSVASYDALTARSTGAITMAGGMAITTGSCTITFASGTVLSLGGQNYSSTPGVTFTANARGVHYTSSGCVAWGIPASGTTGSYSGTFDIPAISVS